MQEDEDISRRRFLGLGVAGVAIAAFPRTRIPGTLRSAPAAEPKRSRHGYKVFSPARIAGLRTTNRLIRSATAEGASPDGRMNAEGLGIYERLARGGVGLIITGHMVAARGGDVHGNQTHIDDSQYVDAASHIAETVHRYGPGCKVVAQLSHAGPNAIEDPIAPSDVGARRDGRTPRVLPRAR
jgi:2,4-dienoyl-CoA reductase-like NADH-dependent reductase (Old Yellow Enzyme family)